MRLISFLLLGVLFSLSSQGHAQSRDYGESLQNFTAAKLLENAGGSHDHWRGIGRLSNGDCTATLLDTRDTSTNGPTPAYVLTAGHCIESTNGNIVTDRPIWGLMRFNYFVDTTPQEYRVKKVAWRSMQGVDMAIIELDVSLQKLISEGIQPLKLARQKPADGTDVLIVSAPQGLVPTDFKKNKLRMAACTLQPANELVEGPWVWRNTMMTRCKDIAGGSSGGPILDRYSNEIIGVMGTGNLKDGLVPCRMEAPCTPVAKFYTATPGNVYGNPADFLGQCFPQGRIVNNATWSCPLYPVFTTVSTDRNAPQRYLPLKKQADGSTETPTWNYRFSIDTDFYRHKTVRSAKDCEKPYYYSDALSSTDAFINSRIGTQPGYYFLCIVGVESATQRPSFGLMGNALSLPVEILADPP
ncbi:serine protease [Pseudomonas sp. PCH446]